MLTSEPLRRERPETCLSDLQLDRLRVEEIDAPTRADLEAHLRKCERCRARLEALVADAEIFAADPPRFEAPAAVPTRRRAPLVAGLATLAAAALVLVIMQREGDDSALGEEADVVDHDAAEGHAGHPDPDPDPGTRTKGGARLGFAVRRAGRTFEGGPGQTLHPGDALRFHYSTPGATPEATWLAVLGVDAAGTIGVYYPSGSSTARVPGGEDRALESSVILDDTLGEESIVGVFCAESQAVATLTAALEQDPRAPELPAGCTCDRIAVEKIAEAD